jgi:hypothetical protein
MDETAFTVFDDGRVIFGYRNIPGEAPFDVEIRCPIESKLHTEHEAIMRHHRAWAASFPSLLLRESYQRFCDTRFDLLVSYQYHDLPLTSAALAGDLMTWFFVFDDVMDMNHGPAQEVRDFRQNLTKRHLDLLNGELPNKGDTACIHAFADFLQKTRKSAGDRSRFWYERMLHHLHEYVLGAHWEGLIGPTTGDNANTALYLQIRHMAVGVSPCLDLMAMARTIPDTPFRENFFIQRLERLTINYSIWINDLAGLGRDIKRGLGNVIFTLQRDHALTVADAARMVARMCDNELAAFFEVEKQLPMLLGNDYRENRIAYDAYVDVLKRWMRGLLDWSARSARYQRTDVDMALQDDASILQASRKMQQE